MSETKKPHRPIGYLLRQIDNLVTEQVNNVQAANGVTRTEWQTLNILYEVGPADKEQLFTIMQPFVDAAQLEQILTDLMARGWVMASENGLVTYQLSDEGRQQHGKILAAQQRVRQQIMQGISQEDYATVMRVLQQMAANLETAVNPADPSIINYAVT